MSPADRDEHRQDRRHRRLSSPRMKASHRQQAFSGRPPPAPRRPAVSRLARIFHRNAQGGDIGDRLRRAAMTPASAACWIGLRGGTYQTIGRVRNSGCSGKAILPVDGHAIDWRTCLAASSHGSGIPSARAAAMTLGILGIEKDCRAGILIEVGFLLGRRRLPRRYGRRHRAEPRDSGCARRRFPSRR